MWSPETVICGCWAVGGTAVISTIRNRPVTSFLLITFGVSYGLGIPFAAAVSSIFNSSSLAGLYLPRVVTVIGPAVAGVVVALACGGVISVARLLRSLRLEPGDLAWIASCAAVGLVTAGVAFVFAGLPIDNWVDGVTTRAPLLFAHVLIQVTVIGVGEELGWRGWLLPTLSARRSFLAATALTGLAWALWHLPLLFSGLSIALSFTVLVASLSIVLSWLWYRTAGGIGVIALAHGFANAPFFFLEQLVREMPDGEALTVRAFAYWAGSYSAIAFALAVNGRHVWGSRGVVSRRLG
jgi:membrane protease YdiL (CAAX protease family)